MKEVEIQSKIRDELCQGGTRVYRNNVGSGLVISHKHSFTKQAIISKMIDLAVKLGARASRIKFGLHEGSGDLIGYKQVTITPDMVGTTVAVFLSVEIKTDKGRPSEAQARWLEHVNSFGGLAIIARSPDEARKLVDGRAFGVRLSPSNQQQGESNAQP